MRSTLLLCVLLVLGCSLPSVVLSQDTAIGECPKNPTSSVIRCGRVGNEPLDGKQVDCFIESHCMGRFARDLKPIGKLECNGKEIEGRFVVSDYRISYVPNVPLLPGLRCSLWFQKSSVTLDNKQEYIVDDARLRDKDWYFSFVAGHVNGF